MPIMQWLVNIFIIILSLLSLPCIASTHESTVKRVALSDNDMLNNVEKATFQWFYDHAHPVTGLVADRGGSIQAPASIAGTGFGLVAYAIASERGWISRSEAATYTLKVVRGLYNTPQGPQKEGISGYHGFFYHFLDPETGLRSAPPTFWYSELSSIDTAILMAGVLFSRNYYDAMDERENEIRLLCSALYDRVNWPWLLTKELTMGHGYTPESGKIPHVYKGYSEALLLYILAISSTSHPIPPESWDAFMSHAIIDSTAPHKKNMIMLPGMPLFTYQYPMIFIDFRGIRDTLNRRLGFDYFENSRRATLAQWHYAKKNPTNKRAYSELDWGLTASDGPANITKKYMGKEIIFRTYSERGAPQGFDDGTIAPTAAISSIVFTPHLAINTMRHWLVARPELFNTYGFVDAFNPTFDTLTHSGWIDTDRLAIDQGPILLMIENYRSGLVWKRMSHDIQIKQGLRRAGFRDADH